MFRRNRNDNILALSALSIAGDVTFRLNHIDLKGRIQFVNQRMVRVCQYNRAAHFMQPHHHLCKFHMIFLIELFLGIPFEIRIFRNWKIRRIQKNKVTRLGIMLQHQQIITTNDLCFLQSLRYCMKIFFIADFGIYILSVWNIELTLAVDTIQTVKARPIEINCSSSSLRRRKFCPL